ncbi:hypothetical protein M758_1G111300 [Ceratodon purpureus]|nr:hypothetical protein M758_1G111300 [Ceratodon purpureus]
MIAKLVYLFLAVLSMLSSTDLLQKLSITGIIWTGADLIFTIWRFVRNANRLSTNPFKLLLHMWVVELLGDYYKVIYLISTNHNGPDWGVKTPEYKIFKWLFVWTSYSDPFSGLPQKVEFSTSIIIEENPMEHAVQGCLRELKPLKLRLRSCIVVLDEESKGWCLIMKSTNVSKKWKFDRLTAEVLYQVFEVMDDATFMIEGDSTAEVLHCIELDKFIRKTIEETRSGLIAHFRVVVNEEMKAFI